MARVLIVDDDSGVRQALRLGLERRGHRVEEAADGAEALIVQRLAPADVAIIDVAMPVMGGLELTAQLRREFPALRIVVVTGGAMTGAGDFLEMARRIGADHSLAKPFTQADLAGIVEGGSGTLAA